MLLVWESDRYGKYDMVWTTNKQNTDSKVLVVHVQHLSITESACTVYVHVTDFKERKKKSFESVFLFVVHIMSFFRQNLSLCQCSINMISNNFEASSSSEY